MKLNNRGFAVTTLLYGILILIFLSVFSIMAYMSTNRSDTKKLIESIKDDLSGFDRKRAIFSFDSVDTSSIGLKDVYYTEGIPYQVSEEGYYKIELCGAQGGNVGLNTGGKGACTSGLIYLEKGNELKFYLGGQPSSDNPEPVDTGVFCKKAGLGGGGYVCGDNKDALFASGGGATYVKFNDEVIMVAAGGGGATSSMDGGAGGALIGLSNSNSNAQGGNQKGGMYLYGGSVETISAGAGGSGYYGGSAGTINNESGAGGSSYISGYAGVISQGQSNSEQTISKTNKYFINAEMNIGENEGNEGNGTAKIEKIDIMKSEHNIRYIKDCITNTTSLIKYSEMQVISGGKNIAFDKIVNRTINDLDKGGVKNITDGDITTLEEGYVPDSSDKVCLFLDLGTSYDIDEIAIWSDWENSVSHHHTIYTSNDGSTYNQIYSKSVQATVNGIRLDFNS